MSKSHLLAAAAGAVVTSALAGGVAWATIPGDGGVIQGCYTKIGGILRVIDTAKGERCLGIEVPISWNQKGLKGDPGANGAPGVSPTVAQLQPGDSNCPAGGAAITAANGSTAYACNGTNGANGQSFAGTFTSPNGEYSISVADTGITLSHGPTTSIKLVGDSLDLRSAGSTEVRAATTATIESGMNLDLHSGTSAELRAGTSAKIHAGSDFTVEGLTGLIQSTGVLNLKGSAINMN
jgi:hypothetical protein